MILSFKQLWILWVMRQCIQEHGHFQWSDLYKENSFGKRYIAEQNMPEYLLNLIQNQPTQVTKNKLLEYGLIEWPRDRKPPILTAKGYALLEELDSLVPEGKPWWQYYPTLYREKSQSTYYWRRMNND